MSVDDCVQRINNVQRNLWERTTEHNDFLKLRIGLGDLPLEAEIKYPEKRFTTADDNLMEELYKLAEEPKMLHQVPVTLDLVKDYISGIIGERENVTGLAKSLIIQLTALHSYDELKLVFIYEKKEQSAWEFLKWLPHVWNEDKTIRFIATNPNEVKELSAFFEKEIAKRESITNEDELKEVSPHYVVFAMSKSLAGKAEMLNLILKQKKNAGQLVAFMMSSRIYQRNPL